jgi:hypothetical protein
MRAAFMDTMAVTGRFKKQHLFIMQTANPNWKENQRELNDKLPCMDRDEGCTKRYPWAFCEETLVDEDGYPLLYTADATTRTRLRQGRYNPYLTHRYQAHISVEVFISGYL